MHGMKALKRGPGDIAEYLAKPIAKAVRMSCLDGSGQLIPESGCAKRRDALNRMFGFQ